MTGGGNEKVKSTGPAVPEAGVPLFVANITTAIFI